MGLRTRTHMHTLTKIYGYVRERAVQICKGHLPFADLCRLASMYKSVRAQQTRTDLCAGIDMHGSVRVRGAVQICTGPSLYRNAQVPTCTDMHRSLSVQICTGRSLHGTIRLGMVPRGRETVLYGPVHVYQDAHEERCAMPERPLCPRAAWPAQAGWLQRTTTRGDLPGRPRRPRPLI
jgi:hypothetical protein